MRPVFEKIFEKWEEKNHYEKEQHHSSDKALVVAPDIEKVANELQKYGQGCAQGGAGIEQGSAAHVRIERRGRGEQLFVKAGVDQLYGCIQLAIGMAQDFVVRLG